MDEEITYGALIRHYRQELREAGKADSTISNQVSRLKRFMALAGRDDHDPAGAELEDDETFTQIRDQVIEDGAASNQRAMRSTLQAWRKSYRRLAHQTELPERFADALRVLVDRSDLTQRAIARSAGMTGGVLLNWLRGDLPILNEKGSRRIAVLEDLFGLARGCLAEKVGRASLVINNPQPDPNRLVDQPYALRESEIPAPLETEIRNLVRHKTDAFSGGKRRNSNWRLKSLGSYHREVSDLARVGDQVCPTAESAIGKIRGLFGFLVREKHWSLEDLHLVHFLDPELLKEYIHFLKDRRGHYTNNSTLLLIHASSLIHPDWGYVTQSPEMGIHLDPPVSRESWHQFCVDRFNQINSLRKELEKSGQLRPGRRPNDPIERILGHPKPASWLFTLVSRMEENFSLRANARRAPVKTALAARNIALVKLLTMNPLRVNQLAMMTYRADNTGNLRRKQDGSWELVYEPWEFKNEKGAAKETYRADIHPWAADSLECYLFEHRRALPAAEHCDYVFLGRLIRRKQKGLAKYKLSGISKTIRDLTRTYLEEVAPKGFGPHAFRHIIATHYLKCHPGNYPLVAQILHDKLETVMDAYGHLQVGDGLDAWAETIAGHIKNGGKHDHASL